MPSNAASTHVLVVEDEQKRVMPPHRLVVVAAIRLGVADFLADVLDDARSLRDVRSARSLQAMNRPSDEIPSIRSRDPNVPGARDFAALAESCGCLLPRAFVSSFSSPLDVVRDDAKSTRVANGNATREHRWYRCSRARPLPHPTNYYVTRSRIADPALSAKLCAVDPEMSNPVASLKLNLPM